MTKENAVWKSRIYKDKAVKKQALDDLKVIAYTVIGENRKLIVEQAPKGKPFDGYPSCKNWEKKYCPCGKHKWVGKVKMSDAPGYRYWFFADSEIGVYCKVISSMLGDEIIIPAVV